jgi:YegS/Rv2252/BmrU family lipid kinase
LTLPIIINPAAGPDRPVLKILNTVFASYAIEWDVYLTKGPGDALRFAEQLVKAGAAVLGVYGGDGTVKEVAPALMGQPTLLALLPGGTGNALAVDVGLPRDLAQAAALICDPSQHTVREIDVAQIDTPTAPHYFVLRASLGLETELLQEADREFKDRWGQFAYPLTALRKLSLGEIPLTRYHLTVDGQSITAEGLQCTIANSAQLGLAGGGLALAQGVQLSDGLLDVIVLTRVNLEALAEIAASNWVGENLGVDVLHWQGRSITVEADPPQAVGLGGDVIGFTPVSAHIRPAALRLIVPRSI